MRIAFDVKGTLEGHKGSVILEAFKKLQELGHTCVVWSNLYSYATDAIKKFDLNAEADLKQSSNYYKDLFNKECYDVAIEDDTRQTWLGAKRIIFVDEIPNDSDELVKLILGN